jgi:DNA-directed RNA polymerase subunit RPC12/RpoP
MSCDSLIVVGRDGDKVIVRCRMDEQGTLYHTGLTWTTLVQELRSACSDHSRHCAHCGALMRGVAESRASFCPDCRHVKRRVDIGLASVDSLYGVCVYVQVDTAGVRT